MKSKLLLILAMIMGLITTFLFYSYIEDLRQEQMSNKTMTNILVARKNIQKNQKLSKSMVIFKKVPKKSVHPQTIKDFSDLDGLFANAHISKGEPILKHRLQSQGEEEQFVSKKIQKGYRAVSASVNMVQSVTNLIEPNDLVDVIFSEEIEQNNGQAMITTELLLNKVKVLAVGRRMIESTSEGPSAEYHSVTLELRQEDAVRLVNAQERGNIHMILHSKIIP